MANTLGQVLIAWFNDCALVILCVLSMPRAHAQGVELLISSVIVIACCKSKGIIATSKCYKVVGSCKIMSLGD